MRSLRSLGHLPRGRPVAVALAITAILLSPGAVFGSWPGSRLSTGGSWRTASSMSDRFAAAQAEHAREIPQPDPRNSSFPPIRALLTGYTRDALLQTPVASGPDPCLEHYMRFAAPLFSTVVRRDPDRATVTLHGELDLHTVNALRTCIDELARQSAVVLDFAGLDFIDSAGMHAIGAAAHEQMAHGGSLGIRSPRPAARHLLGFVNFAHIGRIPE